MMSRLLMLLLGAALALAGVSLWLGRATPEAPLVVPTVRHVAPPNPSAPKAQAVAADTAKPAAPKDHFGQIHEADRIGDPMQRCVAIPPPPDYHWSKEMLEAFCADELTPTLPWSEFESAIENGNAASVDASFDALVEGHFAGRVPEGALRHAYNDKFWGSSRERKRLIDHWLETNPGSAHAYAARGIWWVANAEQARGEKRMSDTPEKDIERMRDALGKAKRDLGKAIELNPRIMPAYAALLHATQYDGDDALAESTMRKANEVSPENFYPRAALAYARRPQWGGSFEAMDRIADDAAPYLAKNPRLANLKAIALSERAMATYWARRYPDALRQFDKGLAYGPEWFYLDMARYAAFSAGDPSHEVEFLSQMLRFSPWATETRRLRADALRRLNRDAWAEEDLDAVLTANPRDTSAIQTYISLLIHRGSNERAELKLKQLIGADPHDRWANVTLAWLYANRMKRFPEAAAIIDPLLAKEPESGELWLLRVQLLHASGDAPGMREAVDKFLRYADQTSPMQRDALPDVKNWLAAHPH